VSERRTFNIMTVLVAVCAACVALVLLSIPNARNRDESPTISNSMESSKTTDAYIPNTAVATITVGATSTSQATATVQSLDRRDILAGKSPQEIAEYAVEHFVPSFLYSTGTPEIILASEVTREELPQIGLGCLPDNGSSEEPPYVLVILRGDFGGVNMPKAVPPPPDAHYLYAAMVIDVWAPGPTVLITSATGGEFRTALNDPSLPKMDNPFPVNCPPRTPGHLPHGAVLPGVVFPTSPPEPTITVGATITVPQPVPTTTVEATGTIPQPIPTYETP
jgi:hypothetical protein